MGKGFGLVGLGVIHTFVQRELSVTRWSASKSLNRCSNQTPKSLNVYQED